MMFELIITNENLGPKEDEVDVMPVRVYIVLHSVEGCI